MTRAIYQGGSRTAQLDPVMRELLPVLRYFYLAFTQPTSNFWRHGYQAAIGTWGEARGLAIAHAGQKFVHDLTGCGLVMPAFIDPLNIEKRDILTSDEARILLLLCYMGADDVARARDIIASLNQGRVDPTLVRHGLALSAHLDPAHATRVVPRLTLVS